MRKIIVIFCVVCSICSILINFYINKDDLKEDTYNASYNLKIEYDEKNGYYYLIDISCGEIVDYSFDKHDLEFYFDNNYSKEFQKSNIQLNMMER